MQCEQYQYPLPSCVSELGEYAIRQYGVVQLLQAQFAAGGSVSATLVEPVDDYHADRRRFLGVFAFPPADVVERICCLQKQLQDADPRQFYIPPHALHLTMKNIRTIANPPNYTAEELSRVQALLPDFTREYSPIPMVGYGLLRTPTSCSIPVYTGSEFGRFVCDLDRVLTDKGVPDDKCYNSTEVFFTNVTFVRYSCTPNKEFWDVLGGFDSLEFPLFSIDMVKLVSSNLAFSPELYEEFGAFQLNL